MQKKITISFILFFVFSFNVFASIPYGNGTWAYDSIYNDQGKKIGDEPGLFATAINNFNILGKPGHKLTQVFSYGGDLEMYCQGAGESSADDVCTDKNMLVFYTDKTTSAYFDVLNKSLNSIVIIPILDGRLDQTGATDYLSPFNRMDEPTARLYADKVAKLYCADDRIPGVQFDIEPFDIDKSGQLFFYQQIAKNFAGKNNPRPDGSDPLNCVNEKYKQGRFFSVFTFAPNVNAQLANVLNQYDNGYVIDSLYDLGKAPGGTVSSPADYQQLVVKEVAEMMQKSKSLNVKYQFAIAAAASVHEFESRAGVATGFNQLNYVKAAMEAIQKAETRKDKNFLGIDLWAWNDKMLWQGDLYTPASPKDEVKNYLGEQL